MSVLHSEDVHLIDYLRVVYKRRLFFVVVILVALAGAIYATQRTPRMYRSKARILLDNETALVEFPGIKQYGLLRIDTEMHIMTSREVAERAAAVLKPGLDRREPESVALVERLMNATGVDVVPNTYIVETRTLADDPEVARAMCDAMAEAYVSVNLAAKKQSNAAAYAAIREELDQTQRDLEAAERRLMDFKIENNLVSDISKSREQDTIQGAGTGAQVQASLKKVEIENKYRALLRWQEANDFTLPLPEDVTGTPLLGDMYQQIVKKRLEQRNLLAVYRERHPKVQAVTAELDALNRSFAQEMRASLESLGKQAELYGRIGEAHRGQIESERREFLRENERDWQYKVLQREVEAKEEIYKALLQKAGEINVMGSIVKNNARIIERPKAIPFPVQPNWRFNLLVGLMFGIGVAVAGVFFLEYLDKTLKTPDDVARYLSLPVLAVVPLVRSEHLRAPYEPPQLRQGDTGA
jgi:uncharacterized protein involved in exopolysaccharide biosynthesis